MTAVTASEDETTPQIVERGFYTYVGDGWRKSLDKEHPYSVGKKITGLHPNTRYTYCPYVKYADGEEFLGDSKDVTTASLNLQIACAYSVTTADLIGQYTAEDAKVKRTFFSLGDGWEDYEEEEGIDDEIVFFGDHVFVTGLDPMTSYTIYFYVETENGGREKKSFSFKTEDLELDMLETKVTKQGTAVVRAETNIADEETNVGFEWRKIDAPEIIPSKSGSAVVYKELMEGQIKGLDVTSYYQVRPYYESSEGNKYYGDWLGFDPNDVSYFDATVHTYANTQVDGNHVHLTGYVIDGTDDIIEQGFEYWIIDDAEDDDAKMRKVFSRRNVETVIATGQRMGVTLENLNYATTYACRAYAKTSDQTYYGEEITFKTGENPNGIENVIAEESVSPQSIRHGVYTLQGVKVSDEPTDLKTLPQGIYIVNGKKVFVK